MSTKIAIINSALLHINPQFLADFDNFQHETTGEFYLSVDNVIIELMDGDDKTTFTPLRAIPANLTLLDVKSDGAGGLLLTDKYQSARKSYALKAIADKHAEMLILATGGVTEAERDTWSVQLAAAHDIVAGGDGEGVLIPKPGETLEQLATKVLTKSQTYKRLVGIAGEIKRTAEQEVETLPLQTMDDLAALDAILETAMQRATAALIAAQQPNTEPNA